MGVLITNFSDGSRLEFQRGKFDDFCVFEIDQNGRQRAPFDVDYFEALVCCQESLEDGKIYEYFVEVYERTSTQLDNKVTELIHEQAKSLSESNLELTYAKSMTMVYAGMIAENNKAFTKLGKRIKRLGMHVILCEKGSVTFAAHFMRGKGWREIDEMCRQRGF